MAHIEDRWHDKATKERTERYGTGRRWLLRWRDPDGKERKQSYTRKGDADDKRKDIEDNIRRGQYIDPKSGRITFDEYAEKWLSRNSSNVSTRARRESALRNWVTDSPLGKTPLDAIRPSTVQAWISSTAALESSTANTNYGYVRSILEAAANDNLIQSNPCHARSVTPPRPGIRRPDVWSAARVDAVRSAIHPRYRALVDIGAGLGMRPGEIYGLSVHDIDWFRGTVMIRRQVKVVKHRLVFAAPKGGKERHMPVANELLRVLTDYLTRFPAQERTLPWDSPEGRPETAQLVLTNYYGRVIHPHSVHRSIWHPTLQRAGISQVRSSGPHALRHFYASSALAAGESPVSVAQWLGHASTAYMLQVYGHPMDYTEQQARARTDDLFRSFSGAPLASARDVDEPHVRPSATYDQVF